MIGRAWKNLVNKSGLALVIDWGFHCRNKWVSAFAPYLVNEIVRQFDPLIISSQLEYYLHRKKIRYVLSFEPGWAAPRIEYDHKVDCIKAVMYSDPHYQTERRQHYFHKNGFDYVLSLYKAPFFHHFKKFPENRFVHFPWGVPDQFISTGEITVRNKEVAIFGGRNSDAYDVRNWCREQSCVTNYDFSGVENKKLTDEAYYLWLTQLDAVVAAGSTQPAYNLVTPKYSEIASAGALLIGQYCEDLGTLGFDESNCLAFTKEDFLEKVTQFQNCPEDFLRIRENGRALIRQRHKLSDRIELIRSLFYGK